MKNLVTLPNNCYKKIIMKFKTNATVKPFWSFIFLFLTSVSLNAQQTDLLQTNDVIAKHAVKIGLSENDLKNYRISDAYVDNISGATFYYLQQTYKNTDVLNAIQTVAIKNNNVVSVTGKRIANIDKLVNIKEAVAALSSENAVRVMARHLNLTAPSFITALKTSSDKRVITYDELGISNVPVKAKLLWVQDIKTKKVSLVWQVEIQPKNKVDYWLVNIDAVRGVVIGKSNLNISCNWGDGHNEKNEAYVENAGTVANQKSETFGLTAVNNASYRVIPFPLESPGHGDDSLVTNPWELAGTSNNATTLRWHEDGTTTFDSTRGNNVWAIEDRDGNNNTRGRNAVSTTTSPTLTFDFAPDYTQQPTVTVNQNYAITNLFYWNNIMHDLSYQYGFDEVSGNFQSNNLSRGGLGSDYVVADAQDGISTNNANFSTPADGSRPRMQMFLFDGSPKIDGDLDNGVIAHEYTHGISNRLTGGPSQVTCLQNLEQMGEGWSDYLALMATTDWKTATINDGTKSRTIGTYVMGQSTSGSGIRAYPYTTDMSKNPWTYADFKTLPADPYESTIPEAHYVGEIWCTVLWDMTWNIIQQDGAINKNIYNASGTGGNSAAFKLVMEGMKLQPCSPGFIDGRDAILKADTLLFGGKYSCAIWKAFIRRGMGANASQGNPLLWKDETADFTSASFTKTVSKDSVVQQEEVTYTFQVKTSACVVLSNYNIIDTLPINVSYVTSTGTYNSSNRTVTFIINTNASNTITHTLKVKVNTGSYQATVQHVNQVVETTSIPTGFAISSSSQNKWVVVSNASHSSPYSLFIADAASAVTARLVTTTAFPLTEKSLLTFWHSFNTEDGWDGGRIEISTNNGVTYTDAGQYITSNNYQNSVNVDGDGRKGFSGNSNGFIKTVVNLSSFAGKSVRFRFVFTSDDFVGGEGWYVDDINLISETGALNIGQFFDNNGTLVNTSAAYSTITNGTLPLTWGEFTATKQGNTSLLKWQTLQEINTAYFIIERSTDGENFTPLTKVAAAGNSTTTKTYQFTDNLPLNGNDYYRILQVDKDGKSSYSPIRTLAFLLKQVITITPNPAREKINVTINGNDKVLKIYLTDAVGKTVATFNMQGQYQQISLPNIASGVYYIKILGDGVSHTQKLVIQ